MLRPRRRLWLYLVYVGLAIASIACSSFGSHTDDAALRVHLPTLTRTPLPTLTPTPNATHVAVAMASEPAIADSTSNLPPADSDAPVAEASLAPSSVAQVAPDTAAGNAPAATVDSVAGAAQQPQVVAALSTSIPSPTETPSPTATTIPPTPTETAIPTETSTPTVTPLPQGWVFSGMHAYPAEALNGMVFYGNLMNNTGGPQQLNEINTRLFDAQGQEIPYKKAIDQWPVRAVSQGGQVPFGVVIPNVQGVADFNFEVQSEPGGEIPREDFEFVDINPSTEGEEYCLNGHLKNPGGQLQAYLMVTAVLYDNQDQVINYNNAFKSGPKQVVGDQTLDVALCVKSHQQEVARYELRAWGL